MNWNNMKRFVIGSLLFVIFIFLPLCFYIYSRGIETYPLRPRSDYTGLLIKYTDWLRVSVLDKMA